MMVAKTTQQHPSTLIRQFSVFTANKMGRLLDLITLLNARNVHVLALSVLDTTDSTIIRLVLDDPCKGRMIMREHDFAFNECELVAVEIDSQHQLKDALTAMLEAEVNIHYTYSFITQAHGRSVLALNIEDREVDIDALRRHQFTVLYQGDISR